MSGFLYTEGGKYKVVGQIINTKTGEIVPPYTPFFLLIGNDKRAPEAIAHYADQCQDDIQKEASIDRAREFLAWQEDNPDIVKEPDIG